MACTTTLVATLSINKQHTNKGTSVIKSQYNYKHKSVHGDKNIIKIRLQYYEKITIYETNKLSVYYTYRLQLNNQTSDKIKP